MLQIEQFYGLFLLLGMLAGVALSVKLGGRRVSLLLELPPSTPHTPHTGKKLLWIRPFVGGFLLLFGAGWTARVASGPVLTGINQLSAANVLSGQTVLSALLFLGTAFTSAILINIWNIRKARRIG